MRTVNFKSDVLHAVADKMGLDPEQSNFLENQAIPIGKSIDQWVRRTYDSKDIPEWTFTFPFTPTSHIVTYDYQDPGILSTNPKSLGRVLQVFLVDPNATDAPIDTPFTLQPTGVHVGFEHGTRVWIRYMPPAPRFTAEQWNSTTTYKKDDVVYSYVTGECYRSKVNSNLNHNPISTFSPPPGHEPPLLPAPPVEVTQSRTPDNVGVAARTKIVRISFSDVYPNLTIPNVPASTSLFAVAINDDTGVTIASTSEGGDDVQTISQIMDQIRTDLLSDPDLSTFTITNDSTNLTMTIEDASDFSLYPTGTAYYEPPPDNSVAHLFKLTEVQSYVPGLSLASGQPQITVITVTDETAFPGATYQLEVNESNGDKHVVEYESNLNDSKDQILGGLLAASEASDDTFWGTISKSFSPTDDTLTLTKNDDFATAVRPIPAGGAYWELNPFPASIAQQVIRGAYADLLKEWGQTDKGLAEEQMVQAEAGIMESRLSSTPNPALTGQQSARSRYRIS